MSETNDDAEVPRSLLTIDDLMKMFGVSRETVRKMRLRPDFPKPIDIGISNRWRPEDIDNFLANK